MGRRMKSIVALLMVLALLYWQQDELGYEISYAAEEERRDGRRTGRENQKKNRKKNRRFGNMRS